jgi:peroxiredoxin
MPTFRSALLLACLALPFAVARPRAALAEGAHLEGLMAPELTFPSGLNGIEPGTKLSSFRGRVVWLKFWLRDCPRCRKTLPEAQRLHDLYGKSGLVVLTVVHQYGPDQMREFMDLENAQKERYTFRVASDPTGSLAQAYQVNHRPTDYLIAIDGRVRISNGAPENVIFQELQKYRLKELGPVPLGLDEVERSVGEWKYGTALRLALAAAAKPDAPVDHKQFALRLEALVKRKIEDDVDFANTLWRRKDASRARERFERLAGEYADTPFAARAKEAADAFKASTGS